MYFRIQTRCQRPLIRRQLPVGRGCSPNDVRESRGQGLTLYCLPVTFSEFKRVCYLFASLLQRRLGPAVCVARFAETIGRAPRVVVRDDSRRPLAVVLRASGDAQCRQTAIFPRFSFAPDTAYSLQNRHSRRATERRFRAPRHVARRGLIAFGQNWREYGRSTR